MIASFKVGFLLVCLIPLNIFRWHFLRLSPDRVREAIGYTGLISGAMFIAGGLAWILYKKPQWPVKFAVMTLLVLSPLIPISIVRVIWLDAQLPPPAAFEDRVLAPQLQPVPGAPRVLWIIFDELDQYLAFENRPKSVVLPELDRLQAQSLFATHVQSPANNTLLSMPALISGRLFSGAITSTWDRLTVIDAGTGQLLDWSRQPNVFSMARRLGFNTALIGWQHPYGRLLNESLTYCAWHAGTVDNAEEYAESPRTLDAMRDRLKDQLRMVPFLQASGLLSPDTVDRGRRIQKFTLMRKRAMHVAADRNLGLVLLHLPIPHPPGIFDRDTGKLSADESNDYLDNLVLADRTLGDLRRTMEENGTWDTTTVLVSADHPLRSDMWEAQSMWDNDEDNATGGKERPYVPFLLKLAGSKTRVDYEPEFNSVLTNNLILDVLRRGVSSSQDVIAWLNQQRATKTKPPSI